jgi:hypothetical protein
MALATLGGIAAKAACPPVVPGNTPAANGQRLICLQNELAAATRLGQYELQLKQLDQSTQNLELRRRLDAIADVPPPLPTP